MRYSYSHSTATTHASFRVVTYPAVFHVVWDVFGNYDGRVSAIRDSVFASAELAQARDSRSKTHSHICEMRPHLLEQHSAPDRHITPFALQEAAAAA